MALLVMITCTIIALVKRFSEHERIWRDDTTLLAYIDTFSVQDHYNSIRSYHIHSGSNPTNLIGQRADTVILGRFLG